MFRTLLRTLPVLVLAVLLAAIPAAATGDQDDEDHRAASAQHHHDDDDDNDGHPSGKDRNEEPGGSDTQGKSTSDPDGDSNGGADKPGGDGGFDDDKDGNNGCGNDDDFEDDNRGNCGGKADHDGDDESDQKADHVEKTRRQKAERDETRQSKVASDHCPDHRSAMKVEGSGSETIDGVTISWDRETITFTNTADGDAEIVWCAKGGANFTEDGKTTNVQNTVLSAGESSTTTFGGDISYVVFYDVETEVSDDETKNKEIKVVRDTELLRILKRVDIRTLVTKVLEHHTFRSLAVSNTFRLDVDSLAALRELRVALEGLLELLAGEAELVVTDTVTETETTEDSETTEGSAEAGSTDDDAVAGGDDTDVLSGEVAAAPADDADTAAAPGADDDAAVASAAQEDDDEVSGSDILALTGGSIALLAALALLTLGGGSLLVRRPTD